MEYSEVKIEIYIPLQFIEPLREALVNAGAGQVGNYDSCLSVTFVSGFWRPLEGASPYDGRVGELSQGQECKVEVRCARENIPQALRAIRAVHPYETPLINVVPLLNCLYDEPEGAGE